MEGSNIFRSGQTRATRGDESHDFEHNNAMRTSRLELQPITDLPEEIFQSADRNGAIDGFRNFVPGKLKRAATRINTILIKHGLSRQPYRSVLRAAVKNADGGN